MFVIVLAMYFPTLKRIKKINPGQKYSFCYSNARVIKNKFLKSIVLVKL